MFFGQSLGKGFIVERSVYRIRHFFAQYGFFRPFVDAVVLSDIEFYQTGNSVVCFVVILIE